MTGFHVFAAADEIVDQIKVRRIDFEDVLDALRRGLGDFWEKPSHYVFLCLIYPIAGAVLITWARGANALQLMYPLMTGFALIGPFAAIGLYEISRRREFNLDSSWVHAVEVWRSPAIPAIAAVGLVLVALFLSWIYAAKLLYVSLYGSVPPESIMAFFRDVISTQRGWTLIVLGHVIGFLFALAALVTTVIAFPLLLDRDVGAKAAVRTSARVFLANPVPMLLWGLIVAVALLLGSLPFLVGLAVVLPVLGHSTWHLYRKTVETPDSERRRASR
jgi:uncharacterized membrane protein